MMGFFENYQKGQPELIQSGFLELDRASLNVESSFCPFDWLAGHPSKTYIKESSRFGLEGRGYKSDVFTAPCDTWRLVDERDLLILGDFGWI